MFAESETKFFLKNEDVQFTFLETQTESLRA